MYYVGTCISKKYWYRLPQTKRFIYFLSQNHNIIDSPTWLMYVHHRWSSKIRYVLFIERTVKNKKTYGRTLVRYGLVCKCFGNVKMCTIWYARRWTVERCEQQRDEIEDKNVYNLISFPFSIMRMIIMICKRRKSVHSSGSQSS